MAKYPNSFNTREKLQPGARGETFNANLPGYRTMEDRINRTNHKLNTSEHDVPNIKYQFDFRLPALFRYGFAYGFNQIVVPKGRIVAVDPHMDLVDFDMKKQHNTLTLANGGVPVQLRKTSDKYPTLDSAATDVVGTEAQGQTVANVGKEWAPVAGFDTAYNKFTMVTNSTSASLGTNKVDPTTGRIVTTGGEATDIRPANIPIGVIQRNEYTRDDDALNGMMPGPVLTDALCELPWFTQKDKAEGNPWGSAYGSLFPGALVKSDENGRFILSPLSEPSLLTAMTVADYELERQQVIGQVYRVNKELVPEGAAKWATWALEDRLNSEEFNPSVWPQTGRRGEDAVSNSPHQSTGEYPGYPYDNAFMHNDLHMLGSTLRGGNYDQRMNHEFQYDNLGIPGLTDGKNVAHRTFAPQIVGHVHKATNGEYPVDMYFRASEVNVEKLTISVGSVGPVDATVGTVISGLRIKYADEAQGIVVLEVADKGAFELAVGGSGSLPVKLGFIKKGLAGVPTFLDWDGCIGSVSILLQK